MTNIISNENNNNSSNGDSDQEMRSPRRKRTPTHIQDSQYRAARSPRSPRSNRPLGGVTGSRMGSGGHNGYGVTRQSTPPVVKYLFSFVIVFSILYICVF